MQFTYTCKKADDYSIEFEIESMPAVTTAYFIRRGAREYFDNYHAGATKKGGATVDEIKALIDEAYQRARDGEVPGERTPSDPKKAEAKRRAVAMEQASPEVNAEINKLLGL